MCLKSLTSDIITNPSSEYWYKRHKKLGEFIEKDLIHMFFVVKYNPFVSKVERKIKRKPDRFMEVQDLEALRLFFRAITRQI